MLLQVSIWCKYFYISNIYVIAKYLVSSFDSSNQISTDAIAICIIQHLNYAITSVEN